tara:strand:- start:390 stop:1973 length:1584 start_codon:yes stop_codon:yes gene_type:complete
MAILGSNQPYYSISSFKGVETQGDTGSAGNRITQADLFITPDIGYSLSAADFKISENGTPSSSSSTEYVFTAGQNNVTLPTGVDTVTFSNTAIPYTSENTVRARVALTAGWAMPGSDTVLSIDIKDNGIQAGVKEYIDFAVMIRTVDAEDDGTSYSNTAASGSNAYGTANALTSTTGSGLTNRLFTGSVIKGEATKIGTIRLTAGTNRAFDSVPYISNYTDNQTINVSDVLFLESTSQIVDSRLGFKTQLNYDIIYKNDVATTVDNQIEVKLNQNPVDTSYILAANSNKIWDIDVGSKYISRLGETRQIKVYGTPGATFTILFQKSNGSSILSSAISNATIPDTQGTSTGLGANGVYTFTQEFAASNAETYTFKIIPSGTTTLGPNIPTTVDTYTLKQYKNPVLSLTNSTSASYSRGEAATIYKIGLPGQDGLEVTSRGFRDPTSFQLTWVLTGSGTFAKDKDLALSDFTNTDSTTNGGTLITLTGTSVTGAGTSRITITGTVNIVTFGDQDVAMNLDLDNIVTYTP